MNYPMTYHGEEYGKPSMTVFYGPEDYETYAYYPVRRKYVKERFKKGKFVSSETVSLANLPPALSVRLN